jgi:hypothetical protein
MAIRPGTPNIIKQDYGRNLNRVMEPERGGFEVPNVLLGTIQPTFDFLGTLPYAAVSIYDLLGAADALSIVQAVAVPAGYCWLVDSLDLNTDDNTARILTAYVHYINSAGDFSIAVGNVTSIAGANPSHVAMAGGRFVIPPMGKLEVQVPALTAGKKIRFTMAALQVPLGQFCPRT